MAQFGNITNTGKAKISSKYGPRNIGPGRSRNHKGIDISYPSGTSITSPLDGVIERAASNTPKCGGLIVINHGEFNGKKVKSKYCHVKKVNVTKGQEVTKGQIVGISGGGKNDPGRGNSTGPHIHFEIYENGVNVNPQPYYENSPSGQQTQLPSKIDTDNENDMSDDEETAGGSGEKTPKENARQIAKSILLKLFGAGESSTVTPDVVNEILRYKEIISEQTPTFLTPTLTSSTVTSTAKCGPYKSPIEACESRTESNGGVNWSSNNPQAKIYSETEGKIEAITNKGNWGNAVKIGNKEYFWNGSLTKTVRNTTGNREQIGTGNQLFIRSVSSSNQTPPKQGNGKTGTTSQQGNGKTGTTSSTSGYTETAQNAVKGIIRKLMGSEVTEAPQTNMESIEKLKNTISEEIKMFNKLIK